MGKTSTWNIHYDDPNDIAKGRLQAQKLAESADAAVSSCKQQVFQDYTGKIAQVNIGPDETWYTYVDAATLPKWPLDTAPNNSIIFLYAVNTGTAWNVSVEAGQFYIFNKDKTGKTHYAQISNPYSLTRLVPLANDITTFFTAESSSTKKIHSRLAEAESTIAQLKSEIEALKKKQQ